MVRVLNVTRYVVPSVVVNSSAQMRGDYRASRRWSKPYRVCCVNAVNYGNETRFAGYTWTRLYIYSVIQYGHQRLKGFPRGILVESHRPRSTCDAKCETLISHLNRASDDQSDISGISITSYLECAQLIYTIGDNHIFNFQLKTGLIIHLHSCSIIELFACIHVR